MTRPQRARLCGRKRVMARRRSPTGWPARWPAMEVRGCKRTTAWWRILSKVRCLSRRELRLIVVEIPGVLGANKLRPRINRRPVRNARRPGRREHAFILDGELHLQHLAALVRIEVPAES